MAEPAPAAPNPRRVLISTPGVVNWASRPEHTLQAAAPGGVVVSIPARDFHANLLKAIREQGQKNGTLETLVIDAHGDTLFMQAGLSKTDHTELLSVVAFFQQLLALQKETGVKIADRIVLHACDVFTDLSPAEVAYFRGMAQALDSDIAGATTGWHGGVQQVAHVALFGKDGSVSQDRLTKGPATTLDALNKWIVETIMEWGTPRSEAWFHCHNGKTQEEGAACQNGQTPAMPQERPGSRDASQLKTKNQPQREPQSSSEPYTSPLAQVAPVI